jgi:hypothetical protein
MGFQIEDGRGKGLIAAVTEGGQLLVKSENHPLQQHYSEMDGQAYQVVGDIVAGVGGAATFNVLHITNISATMKLNVTYIRLQIVDADATMPDDGTYFQIGVGHTYTSGGTIVTPVNVNRTSGNTADANCYDNNPTTDGTFTEIDRYYPTGDGDTVTYNKEGSVILGLNDTIGIRCVTGDGTAVGTAYARISFIFI